jgi:hypothetical protein
MKYVWSLKDEEIPLRVLAIDPGKTTGVAVVTTADHSFTDPGVLVGSWELTFSDLVHLLHEQVPLADAIAVERFTLGPQTLSNSKDGAISALEAIGAVRAAREWHNPEVPMLLQSAAIAKRMADNDTLRAIGLWTVGTKGHALDATRHAVLYLVGHGWRPENLLIKA